MNVVVLLSDVIRAYSVIYYLSTCIGSAYNDTIGR